MAKTLLSKRTSNGVAVLVDSKEYLHQCSVRAEEQHGRYSTESRMTRLILAAMHSVTEDYENVESVLAGHVAALKGNQESNPMWMFWALSLLFEAYVNLNRIPEAVRLSNEGKSVAKRTDASAKDPFLEALLHQAIALEAKADSKSRQHGLVVALLTLSWYVSHGFERSCGNAHVRDQLRILFDSYGIRGDEWERTVKRAHLTKYDFIGLLSIVLGNADLSPVGPKSWREREPRVIEVR